MSYSNPPLIDKASPELPVSPVPPPKGFDENQRIFTSGSCIVYLYTNSTFVLNPGFDLAPGIDTCYIYAETISIPYSIKFQGTPIPKTVGLFCNTLTVAPDVTLDISGADGTENNAAGGAADGTNGGTIQIYVECLTNDILQNLRIVANGGSGAQGQSKKLEKGVMGGEGGNGGDGGTISIAYGCNAFDIGMAVYSRNTALWPDRAVDYNTRVLPAFAAPVIIALGYPTDVTTKWNSIGTAYAAYAESLKTLNLQIGLLLADTDGVGLTDQETKTVTGIQTAITNVLNSPSSSPVDVNTISKGLFDTIKTAITTYLGIGTQASHDTMMTSINEITATDIETNLSQSTPLTVMLDSVLTTSSSILTNVNLKAQEGMTSVVFGKFIPLIIQ